MNKKKQNILILDGGHKKTLAIVRTLGMTKRYVLDVGAPNKRAICFFSRYTGHKILMPNPRKEPERYKNAILSLLKIKPYLTVIPVDALSFCLCAEIKQEIEKYSHIRIDEVAKLRNAGNKKYVFALAQKLNIPVPETIFLNADSDTNIDVIKEGQVLKSIQEVGFNYMHYVYNRQALKKHADQYFADHPSETLMLQEKIEGDGYGFFAFYKKGKCKNYFIHRRLREYPPSGGYSVAAEGVKDEVVKAQGMKILDHLEWDGVAMVEFKKCSNDNTYKLLEINPKFWGSLDLSIANGVNFPQMWIDDANGIEIKSVQYTNRKYQWLLNGELFHFLERPSNGLQILKDIFVSGNDFWLNDLLPNLYQIVNIPVHYYKKWRR